MNKNAVVLIAGLGLVCSSFGGIRALRHDGYGGDAKAWQLARHAQKLSVVTNGGAKVVFIGDSITHFWEGKPQERQYFSTGDWKMLNLGTSADRTEHVLWRLNEGGELDGYAAKCIVLMIGTNNTGHFPFDKEPPADTILGIRAILATITEKQPNAMVVLCPIFPRGLDANDPCRQRNDTVNEEIRRFADGRRIFWCDFTDQFLTVDEQLPRELFPDLLHPSPLGYEIWYAAVKPYIDYALSDGALPLPANRFASRFRKSACRLTEKAALCPVSRIRNEGYGAPDWWLDRLMSKRNQIADSQGKIDLVLFGDSITHNWEKQGQASLEELRKHYSVLDIGYSGDHTEHLLWRGMNGELDGYQAKCIMLMIGTNNTWHRKDRPEDIAAGIKAILELLAQKQPQAKVLLLPIFPFGDSLTHPNRVNNDKVNALIRGYADGERVLWVDFTAKFLDEKGDTIKWMPDRCHPNAEGYAQIWLPSVLPYLERFCK